MESVSGFIKTVLNEFYPVTFRKKLYKTIESARARETPYCLRLIQSSVSRYC